MDHAQPALQDVKALDQIRNLILVAKPRMVVANLISAAGGFFLASRGHVSFSLFLAVAAGLSLVVASGCVLNNCYDRGIDRIMARTRRRALATGALSLKAGLLYAFLLGVTGAAVLLAGAGPLAFGVAAAGFVVYVVVYTMCLKRSSVWSTVIGSLAGAAPPVAGYVAVTGRFDLGAFLILAVFSLWQVPHSYAIAITSHDDYAAADLPVMPVKSGIAATRRQIVLHIAAFVPVSLLPFLAGYTGYAYAVAAALLGAVWLVMALSGGGDRPWARRIFLFSIPLIFVLSVLMSVDYR